MNCYLQSDKLKAAFTTHGAELISLRDYNDNEYIWQGEKSVWGRHAPVLFPFICNTLSGHYTVDGKPFALSNHGFARDSEFTLTDSKEASAAFLLCSNDETRMNFPFVFELMVSYRLDGNALHTRFSITNRSEREMPFFIGGHPAFNVPISADEKFTDYAVVFPEKERELSNCKDGKPIPVYHEIERLPLTHECFKSDVLLENKPKSGSISLRSTVTDNRVKLEFDNSGCIAVWSPFFESEEKTAKASFVCLEPWSSLPVYAENTEELTQMKSALRLAPNEKTDFSYTIYVMA
jgi:galactose mutarotase-like enzyme